MICYQQGLGYSCAIGLKKSLEYDVGSVTLVESDGTFVADDLNKMMSYLDDGDMIVGTRVIQVLSEKGTQLGMIHVWGNYILAKLIAANVSGKFLSYALFAIAKHFVFSFIVM